MSGFHHIPVMRDEVLAALAPADGEIHVDCTVGGGGHSAAILAAADCRVVGLDRDPAALDAARQVCAPFGDRFTAVRASFSELGRVLDDLGVPRVHGILADLGVSSHQLDTPERGFSFRQSGPVDMRMDPDAPLTAAEIVDTWSVERLTEVIRTYGEERRARRVAEAIVAGRPWADTATLAAAIASVVGRGKGRIHPATRTFQALRIAVNDELGEVERLLPIAVDRLQPGGRIVILTFQSLEDRIVKRFFAERAGKGRPRDAYGNPLGAVDLSLLPPSTPSPDDPNPRARSARLRSARRLPWNER